MHVTPLPCSIVSNDGVIPRVALLALEVDGWRPGNVTPFQIYDPSLDALNLEAAIAHSLQEGSSEPILEAIKKNLFRDLMLRFQTGTSFLRTSAAEFKRSSDRL
jgi:hypothetical protein